MFDIIINPFTTILLVLYEFLGQNVFLAIVAFTVLVRMAILPMTLRQQRSMKRMQELSPKLKELQEKHKDDRERLVQEQMALYKTHGVNPMASCLPLFIQLPIFIGLWRAIVASLASTPADLLGLEHRILLGGLDNLVPLKNSFLWMNLALPDPYYILPILVVITSYLQQKLITPSTPPSSGGKSNDAADQAAQITKQMTTIMPLFFGFLALTYSSGLSIYFITSNIIGIVQYGAMGRMNLKEKLGAHSTETEEVVVKSNGKMVEATATAESRGTSSSNSNGRQLKPGIADTRLSGSKPTRKADTSTPSKSVEKSTRSKRKSRRAK